MAALLLVGCGEPEPETIINEVYKDPTYTEVLKIVGISRSNFDGKGGSAQIVVKSNVEYNITCDKEWVGLPTKSRATYLPQNEPLTINIESYAIDYKDVNRTATITFTSTDGNLTSAVTVSQTPSDVYRLDLASLAPQTTSSYGGEVAVSLNTNVEYSLEVESTDWLSLVSDDGKGSIKLSTQKNLSTADRSATLFFTAPNMSPLTVVVKQYCFLSEHNNTTIVVPLPDVEE